MVNYVFVTGGVVSGLGKGITAASLGRLLKARGYQVTMQKFDPYINVDPGTMNPIQHGEVFVTDDGTETDLDLGHYERFIDESLDKNSNVTSGKIYWSVLNKERHGDYGGGTVQVIPHITNEIKERFYRAKNPGEERIAIIEVGGTVGDIESQPFLEAIRQFQHDVGKEHAILIHVTLIPYLKASGEMKTKPTQASVKELQRLGLWPDILVCRSEYPVPLEMKDKIALFCNVPSEHVLQNLDVEYLYEAPLAMERENLAQAVLNCLHLEQREPDLSDWIEMTEALKNPKQEAEIAIVGKYTQLLKCSGSIEAWRYQLPYGYPFPLDGFGDDYGRKCGGDILWRGWNSRAGRVWETGHRRHDSGGRVCKTGENPISWNLLGNADGYRGLRPVCRGISRCGQYRVSAGDHASGYRFDTGSKRCGKYRGHSEAWGISVCTG